jgi:monomeric isocitrate dehydrogenase
MQPAAFCGGIRQIFLCALQNEVSSFSFLNIQNNFLENANISVCSTDISVSGSRFA